MREYSRNDYEHDGRQKGVVNDGSNSRCLSVFKSQAEKSQNLETFRKMVICDA